MITVLYYLVPRMMIPVHVVRTNNRIALFYSRISAGAAVTLEELKTQTRAGLENAINQRKVSSYAS